MDYVAQEYYCYACRVTIKGSLEIASHRRGKLHRANEVKARHAKRRSGIIRK